MPAWMTSLLRDEVTVPMPSGADALRRLQHDDLTACQCQFSGDRKTDHPRTHHNAIDLIHSQF
jgi:hypothetical protein